MASRENYYKHIMPIQGARCDYENGRWMWPVYGHSTLPESDYLLTSLVVEIQSPQNQVNTDLASFLPLQPQAEEQGSLQ